MIIRRISFFILLFILSIPLFSQTSMMKMESIEYKYSDSLQVIVVTTKNFNSINGLAQLYERATTTSNWNRVGKNFPVVVGKKGLAWSKDKLIENESQSTKVEGDLKSPAGIFMLTSVFSVSDRDTNMPFTKLVDGTECVDDVKSKHYNTIVNKYRVGVYDWKSSEKMLDVGDQYELGVFVFQNPKNEKGYGSCVFLHIWKDSETGTAGCTAMEKSNLEKVVNWLDSKKKPFLIQMPMPSYKKFKTLWNLP
jgi:zinc D-Ala-D-Ala dipeptidase